MAKEQKQSLKTKKEKKQIVEKINIGKKNYGIALIGLALIILSYGILEVIEAVDDVLPLSVAPVLMIVGFIVVGYGIMYTEKKVAISNP